MPTLTAQNGECDTDDPYPPGLSIAQVHCGTLVDGSDVVLKVQRPGIAAQIEGDLHILRFLAKRAIEEIPESKAVDPYGLLREFERTMRGELDFHREAEHMRRFSVCFADKAFVAIPSVIDDLVTGRVLEHWHTGVMTRRSRALSAIEPESFVEVHPDDCGRLGLADGDFVRVRSRRGEVTLPVRRGAVTQPGSVFIPFHYREAAANVLTTDVLDPDGKIPEFKFCAVRVERADS